MTGKGTTMELTKQDKKNMQERTRRLSFRITRRGKGILTPLREDILRGDNQGMPAEYRDDRLHSRDDNETIRRWQDVDTARNRYTTYPQWL